MVLSEFASKIYLNTAVEIDFCRADLTGQVLSITGSSNGLTRPFIATGPNLHRIELSSKILDVGVGQLQSDSGKTEITGWNAWDIPYPVADNSVDAVVVPSLGFSLFHTSVETAVLEENRLFHEYWRMLKPAGKLIVNAHYRKLSQKNNLVTVIDELFSIHSGVQGDWEIKDGNLVIDTRYLDTPGGGRIRVVYENIYHTTASSLFAHQVTRTRRLTCSGELSATQLARDGETQAVWSHADFLTMGHEAGFDFYRSKRVCSATPFSARDADQSRRQVQQINYIWIKPDRSASIFSGYRNGKLYNTEIENQKIIEDIHSVRNSTFADEGRVNIHQIQGEFLSQLTPVHTRLRDSMACREIDRQGFTKIPNFINSEQVEAILAEIKQKSSLLEDTFESDVNTPDFGASLHSLEIGEDFSTTWKILQSGDQLVYRLARELLNNVCRIRPLILLKDRQNETNYELYHFDHWGKRYKAWIYLTDVTAEDAPTTVLKGSHQNDLWRSSYEYEIYRYYNPNQSGQHPDSRSRYAGMLAPDEVAVIGSTYAYEEISLTGAKGDMIVWDTRMLHAPVPLIRGPRLILSVQMLPVIPDYPIPPWYSAGKVIDEHDINLN